MSAFRIAWQACRDLFDELFTLMLVNFLWVVISMPLVAIAVALALSGGAIPAAIILLLAILPLAPASTGLALIAQRIFEGRAVPWRMFFDGFRELRSFSWQVYGVWTAGLILICVNLFFYAQMAPPLSTFLVMLFFYILLLWCALLIHLGPLIVLQENRRLRLVFRNAIVLIFSRPLATFITMFLMTIILILSVVANLLPFLLFTPALFALWGFRATAAAIAESEERRKAAEEAAQQVDGAPAATEKGRGGQIRPRE
jgi:uncharacterized membrane protein YesL